MPVAALVTVKVELVTLAIVAAWKLYCDGNTPEMFTVCPPKKLLAAVKVTVVPLPEMFVIVAGCLYWKLMNQLAPWLITVL